MSAFFRRHDMAPDTKFVLLAGAAQFCLRLRFRLTDLDLFVRDLSSAGVSVHHLGEGIDGAVFFFFLFFFWGGLS